MSPLIMVRPGEIVTITVSDITRGWQQACRMVDEIFGVTIREQAERGLTRKQAGRNHPR